MGAPLYDEIGVGYTTTRQADPRIERIVHAALGGARRVVNARLRADLDTGAWSERNAELAGLEELDLGFRLVVADYSSNDSIHGR